jgi:hypothetical protein
MEKGTKKRSGTSLSKRTIDYTSMYAPQGLQMFTIRSIHITCVHVHNTNLGLPRSKYVLNTVQSDLLLVVLALALVVVLQILVAIVSSTSAAVSPSALTSVTRS